MVVFVNIIIIIIIIIIDTEEDFNRNACRQQLCFYIFISACSRGWFSLL